jgi:hypothetical protein
LKVQRQKQLIREIEALPNEKEPDYMDEAEFNSGRKRYNNSNNNHVRNNSGGTYLPPPM